LRLSSMIGAQILMAVACLPLFGATAASNDHTQVIWITLANRPELKRTAPGSVLEGELTRNVYWRDTMIFPKGSTVRLVVDQIASRKKVNPTDDRPFFIKLFAPRHELVARFRSASVTMPNGKNISLKTTFVSLGQRARLTADPKVATHQRKKADVNAPNYTGNPKKPDSPWVLTVEAAPEEATFAALAESIAQTEPRSPSSCVAPCTLPGGTRMPVALMEGVSASRTHQGQGFQAVLLEPVFVGSTLAIPQGTVVQGEMVKRKPPRRLYRPGMVNMMFDRLSIPNGPTAVIAASPISAEVERGTHMKMDAEGKIHAQSPGTARFLLDFAVTGGISKVSDDTTQLIIEAISSTATDASTAGVARFAAMGASAIFLLTRHGRDVILPAYTEMDITLGHDVSLKPGLSSADRPQ
jgi:hypothetical protein